MTKSLFLFLLRIAFWWCVFAFFYQDWNIWNMSIGWKILYVLIILTVNTKEK